MSLIKFFKTIDNSRIGKFFDKKAELIANTDPDRIYVENIRSFFNVPFGVAKFFCELAVRVGYYSKWVGFYCKNDDCGRMIGSFPYGDEVPDILDCKNCEILEKDQFSFRINELERVHFYKINRVEE